MVMQRFSNFRDEQFSDQNGEFQHSSTNWPILTRIYLKIRLSLENEFFDTPWLENLKSNISDQIGKFQQRSTNWPFLMQRIPKIRLSHKNDIVKLL